MTSKILADSSATTCNSTLSGSDDHWNHDSSSWNMDLDDMIGNSPSNLCGFKKDDSSEIIADIRRAKNPEQSYYWSRTSSGRGVRRSKSDDIIPCSSVFSAGIIFPSRRNSERQTPKRTVSFDKVQVREFQQILGENPFLLQRPDQGETSEVHGRDWNGSLFCLSIFNRS